MKKIKLTQGKYALVDNEDFKKINKYKWYAAYQPTSRNYSAVRAKWSRTKKRNQTIYMHRIIINAPKYMSVDHIDHNSLDNQKNNLRICTTRDNNRNVVRRKDNKSGYKGVWKKDEYLPKTNKDRKISRKVWISKIGINGRQIPLGLFFSPIDAAKAYNKAAKKYFGEFAYLNKIS